MQLRLDVEEDPEKGLLFYSSELRFFTARTEMNQTEKVELNRAALTNGRARFKIILNSRCSQKGGR